MSWFLTNLLLPFGCVTVAYIMGWRDHEKSVKNPYVWFCTAPGCSFKVSSNQHEWTLKLADSHEEAFHR